MKNNELIQNRIVTLLLLLGLLSSCDQNKDKTISNKSDEPNQLKTDSKSHKIYGIVGEDIIIRIGPGENFDKLINKKATEALKETQYAQVDYSVKVLVEESQGDWSRIKVVEPEWLSSSHIGWIPTKNIINEQNDDKTSLKKLAPELYELIITEHNVAVQNFYVVIKYSDYNRDNIFDFIKKFRNEHCTRNCNVWIYDSKSISPLIDKYPLEGKEYIELADHFVAMSSFDAPNLKSWYPYQDFQYKEYGGKNWKKEPIK